MMETRRQKNDILKVCGGGGERGGNTVNKYSISKKTVFQNKAENKTQSQMNKA